MLSKVKVGDKVWSVRKGWLEVLAVHPTSVYAVELSDCGRKSGYCSCTFCTFSGKAHIDDPYPSYFLHEIKIEVPKRMVEKTLTVFVNYYPDRPDAFVYLKEDNKPECQKGGFTVKCTGTYEVLE